MEKIASTPTNAPAKYGLHPLELDTLICSGFIILNPYLLITNNLLAIKNYLEQFSLPAPQEFIPKIGYSGQNLNKPVAKGMRPIQPHKPTILLAARATKTSPIVIRSPRSIRPTLHFICPPYKIFYFT
jgi:hypothetical protein